MAEGERSEGRGGGLRSEERTEHPEPRAAGGAERDQREPDLRGEPKDADGREDAPETRRWGVGCSVMVGRKRRHAQLPMNRRRDARFPNHHTPKPTCQLTHAWGVGRHAPNRELGARCWHGER